MLVVADRGTAERNGWPVLAVLDQWVSVGCDPKKMGLGPVHAIRRLTAGGLRIADCQTLEINEAFAAQTVACQRELGVSPSQLNPHGGAIAVGHPLGASGARLLIHLAHQIASGFVSYGLAALCVGGGQGIASVVRRAD